MAQQKTLLQKRIELALDAGLVPYIEGKPGIGKSSIMKQVAEEFNLKLIDVRLSTMDPTDISGIPMKTAVTMANGQVIDRMTHVPSTLFPLQGEALPPILDEDGKQVMWDKLDANGKVVEKNGKPVKEPAFYDGWLLFFDEITQCMPSMQGAVYRIILDREVSEYKLHPNVAIAAAGNGAKDTSAAQPLDAALRARLCVIEHILAKEEWLQWAYDNNIDRRFISFLQWQPTLLHAFDPRIQSNNNPLPRTWEMADRMLKANGSQFDSIYLMNMQGLVGTGARDLFEGFLAYYSKHPDLAVILKDPKNAEVPTEPGVQYALSGVLAEAMAKDPTKVKEYMEYVSRMEPELTAVTMIGASRQNRKLMANADFNSWVMKNKDLIGAEI